ncbi:hypothetical protein EI94DRAFT_1759099 [Lactarius quietus]|nr:hypothetical protein EI94DRAFT_1759099 [Lactarius quietus]
MQISPTWRAGHGGCRFGRLRGPLRTRAIEDDVCECALFVAALAYDVKGLKVLLEPPCVFRRARVTYSKTWRGAERGPRWLIFHCCLPQRVVVSIWGF